METLGRICCWIAALVTFATLCSLPLLVCYLSAAGPQWLIDDVILARSKGHASEVAFSAFLLGAGLSVLLIALISLATAKRNPN